jgi:hypothetical protein
MPANTGCKVSWAHLLQLRDSHVPAAFHDDVSDNFFGVVAVAAAAVAPSPVPAPAAMAVVGCTSFGVMSPVIQVHVYENTTIK